MRRTCSRCKRRRKCIPRVQKEGAWICYECATGFDLAMSVWPNFTAKRGGINFK